MLLVFRIFLWKHYSQETGHVRSLCMTVVSCLFLPSTGVGAILWLMISKKTGISIPKLEESGRCPINRAHFLNT